MTDLSTLLNEEQLAAATAADGPLLILAAAGTGKTRTLVYRVVHLIERGYAPSSILLLTFTNRAAREMLERASAVNQGIASGIWGGTFHHVANIMLRRYGPRLKFPSDFRILDSDDQKSLMAQCIKSAGFNTKDFVKREMLLGLISGAVNRGCAFTEFVEAREEDIANDLDDLVRVAESYGERKRDLCAMDFDDLLKNALVLLQDHEDVREHYQHRFRHVLVDEYQDTNVLQSAFVDILAERHRNLSVVGDDFQCIYSWRGSNFRNIMDFPTRYPDAKIVKLEQNYRSRPEILEVANASIRHNPDQFQKQLRAVRPSKGMKPLVHDVYSDSEQSAAIVKIIRDCIADGYSYSDITILYRSHFHSIDAQMSLARAAVSYSITSGVGFFEQAHAKDVIALIRLLEFPADRLSFERVMSLLKGAGPATVEKVWSKLGGVFDAAQPDHRRNLLALLPSKLQPQWEPLDAIIADYKTAADKNAPGILIDAFLDIFYRDHLKKNYENAGDREDDLHELAVEIERNESVKAFLADVALLTNVDVEAAKHENGDDTPRVLLSTIHQAKGLEWPVVILLWAVEGMFPSARAIAEDEDDSEERRLFYVAVTRAKDRLHIMTPRTRHMHDGGIMPCEPTRFIREIPRELYTEVVDRLPPPSFNRPRIRW